MKMMCYFDATLSNSYQLQVLGSFSLMRNGNERKIVRKKLSFMHTKRFNNFLKDRCNSVWVQFHVYHYFICIYYLGPKAVTIEGAMMFPKVKDR